MSLSRKHYQAVADILKTASERTLPDLERQSITIKVATMLTADDVLSDLTDRLCAYFQSDNPNFRPDTFRKAAQP